MPTNDRSRQEWTLAALCFVAMLVAAPSPLVAQSPEDSELTAQEHFELGQTYYERGEFADAAREFEAAYAADPRPMLLYNAYLAYRDLLDTQNAARTLRRYLDEATELDPASWAQLRRRLEALDAALADEEAAPSVDADPAPVEPPDETPLQDVSEEEPSAMRAEPDGLSPVGFVVAGAGVALGLAAVVTGILSNRDHDQLAEQCNGGSCPDTPELRTAQSRGSTLATTTDVLGITGAAAAVTGVVLIFALRESPSDDSASSGGTTAGFSCTGQGCMGTVNGSF